MRALFVWSVTAVCLGIALVLAWKYALPLPFWDEWLWIPQATGNEPVTLEWLWEPYNEHRLPLPKIVYLGWAAVSGMDARPLALLNTLAFGGLAIASIILARRIRGRTSYYDTFFPLLFLHGTHLENLIWPFQIGFVLPTCILVVVLFLIIRKAFIGIGLCLLVLSLAGPVGLPVVILLSPWVIVRGRRPMAAIPAALAMIISGLYFLGLGRPEAVSPSPSPWASLAAGLKCLATGMGQRAEEIWPVSGILILILVGVGFFLILRARATGLGLALAGLCGLALGIGHARAGMGEEPIFVFRYTTITCLVPWIVYVASLLSTPRRRSRVVRVLLVAMMGALFWPNTEQWIRRGKERRESGEAILEDVRAGRSIDDLADRHWRDWNPQWSAFAEGMEMLAGAHMSVYRDSLPVPATREAPAIWAARTMEKGSPDSGDGVRIPGDSWGLYAHPHSVFSVPVPGETAELRVSFGILEGGYLDGGATDGVLFRVLCQRGSGSPDIIWSRLLEPLDKVADRGTQEVGLELRPPMSGRDAIILETLPGPGGNPTWDWAYWAGISFVTDPP